MLMVSYVRALQQTVALPIGEFNAHTNLVAASVDDSAAVLDGAVVARRLTSSLTKNMG